MNKARSLITVELIISLLAYSLCMAFFTLVGDDYGAFSYFNLPGGQFSNYPHIDYFYNGLIGISMLYKWLYVQLPAYNWVGISFILLTFSALWLLLHTIKNMLKTCGWSVSYIITVQVFFALFFVENMITLAHTRFSLIFCGIGLFNLAFSQRLSKTQIALNTALFVLGTAIRPESSLGMFLVVGSGYLIYRFNPWHLLKRLLLPSTFTAALFGFIAFDWAHTTLFVKKVEPEIEYKIMDKRMVPLATMKTATDSVKYEAVKNGLWFDTEVLTPQYMRSLLLPGLNLNLEHSFDILKHTGSFYWHYSFLPALILIAILLALSSKCSHILIIKLVLYQIAVFAIIYAVDFNGHLVGGRHFLNLQLIALLITLFYLADANTLFTPYPKSKLLLLFSTLVLGATTGHTMMQYKQENNTTSATLHCYETTMAQLENTCKNRLVVSTLSSVTLLDRPFSVYNRNYNQNQYIIFDVFTYSLSPQYMAYLSSVCGCNAGNPVAFFNWLTSQKAIYITDPERYHLTERYMQLVHRQKLRFISGLTIPQPPCMTQADIGALELRQVQAAP